MTQDTNKQQELHKENLEEKQLKKDASRIREIFDTLGFNEFAQYLRSPWRIMFYNFVAGIFRGLGIVVGMTVVIAFLIWLLGHIVDFPLIGDYFMDLKKVLESFNSNMQ